MKTNIRFLVMDVDGTLTDGKIYMGDNGELCKAFDIKDGCGIKDLLPRCEIIPIIITARRSQILINRCRELHLEELYQGEHQKITKLQQVLSTWSAKDKMDYSLANVAYIGDDVLDLQCMNAIKEHGGIVGCPVDAAKSVLNISDFVSSKTGGNGAVREFIEYLISGTI